ncbi:hypothetical protein Tco_1509252 [Tanacetum coccineum]
MAATSAATLASRSHLLTWHVGPTPDIAGWFIVQANQWVILEGNVGDVGWIKGNVAAGSYEVSLQKQSLDARVLGSIF